MIEPIAKVKLTDKTTWVDSGTIAISASELIKYGIRLRHLQGRKIIVLSIIPDDSEYNFVEILKKFFTRTKGKFIRTEGKFKSLLTSSDCACYNDMPDWCDEEIQHLIKENQLLIESYPDLVKIGILKGYNTSTYEMIKNTFKALPYYLIYLTGEIRSNPRYFSIIKFFQDNFPEGLDKPVYLHGCPLRKLKDLPKLKNIDIKGIITAGHITDAIYRGNPHYNRETRIKTAWTRWSEAIRKITP